MIQDKLNDALNELEKINLALESKETLTEEQLSTGLHSLDVIDSVYKFAADQHRPLDIELAHSLNRISRVAGEYSALQGGNLDSESKLFTAKVANKLQKLEAAITKNNHDFGHGHQSYQNQSPGSEYHQSFEKDYSLGEAMLGAAKMGAALGVSAFSAGMSGAINIGAGAVGAGMAGAYAAGKGAANFYTWAKQRWTQNANACEDVIAQQTSTGLVNGSFIDNAFARHRGSYLTPQLITPPHDEALSNSINTDSKVMSQAKHLADLSDAESSKSLVKPAGSFLDFRQKQEEIQFLKTAETLARNLSEANFTVADESPNLQDNEALMESVKNFTKAAEQLDVESKSKLSSVAKHLLDDVDKQLEMDSEATEKLSESVREALEQLKSVFSKLLGRDQENGMVAT